MRAEGRAPQYLEPGSVTPFADPRDFDRDGLVAFGGDLAPQRLLLAYRSGLFPWYSEGTLPMWWSPDPRGVMTAAALQVSRSLQRTLRVGGFSVSWNRDFPGVMADCGRRRAEGTWVLPEMLVAYVQLHRLGHAHSLEVWQASKLVGGIYGVQIGAFFAAESMFYRCPDMSKVALVALIRTLFAAGIELFDVQFVTPHLRSLGAFEITRVEYLRRLARATMRPVHLTDPLRGSEWQRP